MPSRVAVVAAVVPVVPVVVAAACVAACAVRSMTLPGSPISCSTFVALRVYSIMPYTPYTDPPGRTPLGFGNFKLLAVANPSLPKASFL